MITELKIPIENGTHINIRKILNDEKVVGDIGVYGAAESGDTSVEVFQSVYGNAVIPIADTKSTLEEIQAGLEAAV